MVVDLAEMIDGVTADGDEATCDDDGDNGGR